MELEEQHDDEMLMGTDAGFYGFIASLSGAPPPADAQAGATLHVKAAHAGEPAALPTHVHPAPDGGLLFAPRPPDSQAQPPLPALQWPGMGDGGACLQRQSSSSGNSMGGAADGAGGAAWAMSEGATAQQPPARRRGSGGSGDEDARHNINALIHKTECERDKNRAAQKAFRARKKEREAAKEAQLAQLSARLAALEMEKRALVARNVLLQRAVAATALPVPGSAAGGPGSAAVPAPPRAQGQSGRIIRPARGWESNLDWGPEDTLELTLGEPGTALRWNRDLLLQNDLPNVPIAWKSIINKLAALLPEAGKEPDGPAAAKLKVLVAEMQAIVAFRATVAPGSITAWISKKMEDVPLAPEAPTRAMWKRIMGSMALSAEQKAALLANRQELLARLGELLQERRAMQARLRAYTLAMLDGERYAPVHGKMVGRYCELRKDSEQLEANIQALHRSKCTFFCRCARQIFRPIQAASFAVQAYPFLPDILSLVGLLADEASEPPRQSMAADNTALHAVKEEPDAQPAPSAVVHKGPALVPAS